MNKEEIFNYLDEKLGEKTPQVIAIKDFIQTKEDMLEKIENMLYKKQLDNYDTYTANIICDIQSDFKEILRGD